MAVIEQLGKSKQVPLRSEIQSKYKWDNYAVYPSDEAWQEDFDRIDILQEPLNQLQGHLGDSVQNVISAFEKDDSIDFIIEKLFTYAKTRHYVDKTDSKSLSLVERIRLKNSTSSAARSWIDPEILSLPEEKLNQYQNHSEMQFWLRRFDEIVRYKPHTLSRKEEELLSLISPALESNSNTYLLLTDADMKYGSVLNDQGEEIELSQGNYIQFLQSSNREVRKNAWVTMHSAHIAKKNTICSALNGQIKSEIFKMKARKYNSCLEHALFGDQIDSQVYKSLIHAVHEKLPSLFKYFSIKQRLLNLEALDFYDMSVPLIKDYKIEMSFEEARELVLQALAPLGDEYVTIARRGLTSKEEGGEAWVDVFENQGKRSNCCSISTYMQVPYILLNYNRDLDDVFTLAHELGHAMHSYLSHHAQPHHMAYYRLVVAEIASTTNEMLLQHFLMEKAQKEGNKEMEIFLIDNLIQKFRGTIIRQTQFAEFELDLHSIAETGNDGLSPDVMSSLFSRLNSEYYGYGNQIDGSSYKYPHSFHASPQSAFDFLRVPHFFYNFYVYKYATSMSVSNVLSQRILNGSTQERQENLHKLFILLKAGCSKPPLEIMADAGVDIRTPKPFVESLEFMEKLIERLDELTTEQHI